MENFSEHSLPTHADLLKSDEIAFKHNKLLDLLNQPPHISWIKKHDMITVKGKPYWYLPIDKQKWLLTRIFGLFTKTEILKYSVELNSFVVAVRLHYRIPGTDVWLYKDGIGAVPVQVDKGQSASNLAAVKNDAGMKGLPAAKSYAESNACEQLGKIFGADLNKVDAMPYMGLNEINEAETRQAKAPDQVQQSQPPVQPQPVQQQATPVYHPQQPDFNRPQYGAQPQVPAFQPPSAPFPQPPQQVQPPKQTQGPQQAPQAPSVNNFNNYNDL